MDISKAIDCINHDISLTKLRRYGVNFNALQWIRSYLSAREHFVSWNQTHSPTLNLNIDVSQESITSTILSFVLFAVHYMSIMTIDDAITSTILSFVLFAVHYMFIMTINDAITSTILSFVLFAVHYMFIMTINDAIQILNTGLSKVAFLDTNKLGLK